MAQNYHKSPQRIQLSRAKGFRLQEASRALNGLPAFKVDRSTKWGNPFYVGEPDPKRGTYFACVDIQEAVEAFEYSLLNDGVGVGHLLDHIAELRMLNDLLPHMAKEEMLTAHARYKADHDILALAAIMHEAERRGYKGEEAKAARLAVDEAERVANAAKEAESAQVQADMGSAETITGDVATY